MYFTHQQVSHTTCIYQYCYEWSLGSCLQMTPDRPKMTPGTPNISVTFKGHPGVKYVLYDLILMWMVKMECKMHVDVRTGHETAQNRTT